MYLLLFQLLCGASIGFCSRTRRRCRRGHRQLEETPICKTNRPLRERHTPTFLILVSCFPSFFNLTLRNTISFCFCFLHLCLYLCICLFALARLCCCLLFLCTEKKNMYLLHPEIMQMNFLYEKQGN